MTTTKQPIIKPAQAMISPQYIGIIAQSVKGMENEIRGLRKDFFAASEKQEKDISCKIKRLKIIKEELINNFLNG